MDHLGNLNFHPKVLQDQTNVIFVPPPSPPRHSCLLFDSLKFSFNPNIASLLPFVHDQGPGKKPTAMRTYSAIVEDVDSTKIDPRSPSTSSESTSQTSLSSTVESNQPSPQLLFSQIVSGASSLSSKQPTTSPSAEKVKENVTITKSVALDHTGPTVFSDRSEFNTWSAVKETVATLPKNTIPTKSITSSVRPKVWKKSMTKPTKKVSSNLFTAVYVPKTEVPIKEAPTKPLGLIIHVGCDGLVLTRSM